MMIEIDKGFAEAVGIVADAHASAARLCAATGFEQVDEGPLDSGTLALLGLAEGTGCQVLIGHRHRTRGRIRLVALNGVVAGLAREGGQAWDTGGLLDINLRALPAIEPLQRALIAQGFVANAPITDWDFGPLAVREVVSRDADGLCIALMERVRPALQGYENVGGPASQVFNATQVVPDFDAAVHFYRDCLGWQVVQHTQGMAAQPGGANCMGFPEGLAEQIPMRIAIFHPHSLMDGSVEVIAFGVRGHDFSASRPPLRGWASLRFAVSDLAGFIDRARRGGCTIIGPVAAQWLPHGTGQAAAAVTPWGARLEAFVLDESVLD